MILMVVKMNFHLLVVDLVLFISLSAGFKLKPSQNDVELLKSGISELFATGQAPYALLKVAPEFQMPGVFNDGAEDIYDTNLVCDLCDLVAGVVVNERQMGTPIDDLLPLIESICVVMGIEDQRVCKGVIQINSDIFFYIIDHTNNTARRFCGSVLQSFGCAHDGDFEWTIELPTGNSLERPQLRNPSDESFNILHLSDIHYDPQYTPGGKADCGEPICCQQDQGEALPSEESCGYWTDYRSADVPWHLVVETVNQTSTHEFDFVYYTGDIISHRVWDTSVSRNKADITKIFQYFKENYDVPVFPVFGNHEPHPLNVWTSEDVEEDSLSVKWLLELVVEEWSVWLGEDVKDTILRGGYYTVSPRPGFRVVGLNGNICYTDNWWLVHNDVDPFGQLQWLVEVLRQAEENDESVHILAHVPTGSGSCLKVYSREFHRIVERFANVITGQFNGHTHKDEFHVFYNSSNSAQAVGVAFNGASVTPFSNSNPSYKIYQVDQSSFTIVDYEEWTFNLTLANLIGADTTPEWYNLYSFREAYGATNLQPSEVDRVLFRMAENHTLLDEYNRFKYRNGDAGLRNPCGEDCHLNILCDVATSEVGVTTQCDYFRSLYKQFR